MRRGQAGEHGAVVALVLIIIAGVAFLGFEVMRISRVDMGGSAMLRARVIGAGLLDAGLALARTSLAQDDRAGDGPYDVWNYFPDKCEELSLYFTTGAITGVIEDENSRFAINSIVNKTPESPYGIFVRLVETLVDLHGLSGNPQVFVDEVHNWLRPPDGLRNLDAKYLALATPLVVPHRRLRSLDELLLIQWPGSGGNDLETLYYGTDEIPGLRDLLTVHASGPLNMNTAHRLLVYSLPMDGDASRKNSFADRVVEYRNDPLNSLGWKWYETIAEQLGVESITADLCDIASTTYRVYVTAMTGLGRRHAVAIFERRGGQVMRRQIAF